jgi:hypothetical protein
VTAAEILAAVVAMSAMDGEFADDGFTRNLGLELLIETVLDDVAATIRTLFGERRVEFFVDAGRRRRWSMGMLAMLLAGLASRLFGSTFGRTFGERGGLSFGGAFEFVDASLEARDEIAKLLVLAKQLIVGRRVHADLDSDKTVSAVRNSRNFQPKDKAPLNKHNFFME